MLPNMFDEACKDVYSSLVAACHCPFAERLLKDEALTRDCKYIVPWQADPHCIAGGVSARNRALCQERCQQGCHSQTVRQLCPRPLHGHLQGEDAKQIGLCSHLAQFQLMLATTGSLLHS